LPVFPAAGLSVICWQVELMKEGLESHGVKVRKATRVHGLQYFPCTMTTTMAAGEQQGANEAAERDI
jgi:hypothetical protein